jgi:uncharacterized protein (DUF58 family)
MLTRRGVSTLTTSIALIAGGILLASPEFVVAGIMVAIVLVVALISVWSPTHTRAKLSRTTEPRQPRAGTGVTVTLTNTNDNSPIFLTERLPEGNSITAGLSASRNETKQTLSYVTTPLPRGITKLGPAIATRTDFLRLCRKHYESSPPTPLLVWPVTFPVDRAAIESLSRTASSGRSNRAQFLDPRRHGAAFEGDLRAYVPGDEPKRVHWPSSAKAQQLIVRTDALPEPADHQSISADLSPASHTDASFELAISLFASFALAISDSARPLSSFGSAIRVAAKYNDQTHSFRTVRELMEFLASLKRKERRASSSDTAGAASAEPTNNTLDSSIKAPLVRSAQAKRGGLVVLGPNSSLSELAPRAVAIRCIPSPHEDSLNQNGASQSGIGHGVHHERVVDVSNSSHLQTALRQLVDRSLAREGAR